MSVIRKFYYIYYAVRSTLAAQSAENEYRKAAQNYDLK